MMMQATRQLTIGTPVAWKQTDRCGVVCMTIYAVVSDVRPDGRLVLRFVGKSGKAVQRIASAASVVARQEVESGLYHV